jgi:hypothetical protein
MQDPLFVLCRWDVDGHSRLWPTRRRWGRTGEAGGLNPDAALTSPSSAGAPIGSVEEPTDRATNACAWHTAMPFRQRRIAAIAAARSIVDRVPGQTTCGRWKQLLRRGDVAVNDVLNLRSAQGLRPVFAVSGRDAAA